MAQSEPTVPWPQVVKFIGQLNHDLRNHLNAIELQSAFIGEIVTDAEARGEVKRLREMTAELGAHLQRLSSQLEKTRPQTMSYQASELLEDLRAKVKALYPEKEAEIEWRISLGKEKLEIDPQLLLEAFAELFANALAHGRGEGALVFEARPNGEHSLAFLLDEPKREPVEMSESWGSSPLGNPRHGHYALGLYRARGIFEAHDGQLLARFDPATSVLTTTVILPCVR